MKILHITILYFISILSANLHAQELQPLRIGDRVPNVLLPELINHTNRSARLHDFIGDKPLIIDFWFIGCASCVALMPHLDSLQHEYKSKLNVLLSTFDYGDRVADFFANSRYVEGIRFTQAVNDSVLRKLFPATGMPHQIWIDKNGIIKAITDGSAATRENIEKFVQGKNFDFVPKINEELDPFVYNTVQPMMLYNYHGTKQKILHYSYLSEYRPEFSGLTGSEIIDSVKRIVRFRTSTYFTLLYHFAYTGGTGGTTLNHLPSRFIREDTNPLANKPDTEYLSNYFCYDLICRYDSTGSSREAISKNMVSDLDRFFRLKSHVENRKVKHWILKEYGVSQNYRKFSEEMPYFENSKLTAGKKVIIQNITPMFFIRNLNWNSDTPIISELDYNGKMSFEFLWNPDDIESMSQELRKYGLDITYEDRDREVIVLRDDN